ncbi:MAG: sulfatase-like hydrolase/transferase [Planctomycetes bacterium]|nr:sulfatase-like hydrolase/transferase [Planctomycetota bacterium]
MRALLCSLLLAIAGVAQTAERPNVVLIISDDQGYGDFGFAGSDTIRTPNLDRLASGGLVFPRGYVPTALCRPSLATLVTGLYPHQHKITGNDPPRGTERARMLAHIAAVETLPAILGRAGYRSLQTGKWWEGECTCGGFDEGMTHGDPSRGGRHGDIGLTIGRQTMQPAFDFIDGCQQAARPFFLWYAPFMPHTPHDPPERLLATYRRDGVPLEIAKYRAMCTWFDETCGQLLDHLEQRGLQNDTLVVLVTDNGWIQRADAPGFAPRSKRTSYEGGVRTPIVLRWPGHIAPERRDVPVSSVDIPATILSACGVEVPAAWPGVDLRRAGTERGPIFGAEFTHDVVALDDPARSMITRWVLRDPYKLLVHRDPARPDELFDVRADPQEANPIDDPTRNRELRALLDRWWPGEPAAARPRRPNLLFVLTDDQRADQIGCAGHPALQTPVMDDLAARGVRFTNAFVTTAICAASRASIMTARREGRHGYTFGKPAMSAALASETYFARLHAAGYRTGFVGKWGVKFEPDAMDGILDLYRPMSPPYLRDDRPHLTDRIADVAIGFLAAASRDRPFCLSISFHAPHAEDSHADQYIPPPALAELYADAGVPPPPHAESGFAALPAFLQQSLGRERWAWRFDSRDKQIRRTRDYWRMITGVDRALGRILAALTEHGLADDTVIVFASDNGYFLGERGLAGKWLIYEESIRIPLIVCDPRAPADRRGVVCDAMALNLDIAPTLLELAGVEAPASYEGRSLLPWLRGERPAWRSDFLYEHRFDHARIPKSVGVRGERWVYARFDEQQPVFEQLFDLQSDPEELHDLARDPAFATTLATQRARCDELLAK